jgi:anti-anti-sigma regulatory factor
MLVGTVAAERASALDTRSWPAGDVIVLSLRGVLDSSTYLCIRDAIIKSALEEPAAVIVDVSELAVPAPSALAVFTSALWHVGRWPEIPILLVCDDADGRRGIEQAGVARYIPVFPSTTSAVNALQNRTLQYRRRARAELPAELSSLRRARELIEQWLTAWSRPDLIAVAKVIVTALIENVLQHTDGAPSVRLETDGTLVTVAIEDNSHDLAVLREDPAAGQAPSGLHIVGALCRMWGNAPTPSGKTVWAIMGPENRL